MPGYNKKNMEDASSGYQMSKGQKDFEDAVGSGWNKLKGLVGAGDESDAMGDALKKRSKKYESDE